MLLLLDNHDSFTYNLKDYFEQLGEECLVVLNDKVTVDDLKEIPFSRMVISPGPERPAHAGILNEALVYFFDKKPILGICLGHQAIGEFFGAELVKAAYPMHGKISTVKHNGDKLFDDIPEFFNACRYHSLILKNEVEKLPLDILATANQTEIMALRHKTLPLWGVQFHPEAILTEYGLQLLKNWINLTKYY